MFYGQKLNMTLARGDRPAPTVELYTRLLMLREINDASHQIIEFPSNYHNLPPVLKAQIWKIKCERSAARHKSGHQKNEDSHKAKLMDEYTAMTESLGLLADPSALNKYQNQDKDFASYYNAIGAGITIFERGNCGEYTALAVNMLIELGMDQWDIKTLRGPLKGERFMIGGTLRFNNHVCVVVGAPDNINPADRSAYGGAAVVCDPWLDLVCYPHEYFYWLEKIDCSFKPEELVGLHVKT